MRSSRWRALAPCLVFLGVLLAALGLAVPASAQTFSMVLHKLSDADDSVDDFRSGFPALRQCPAPCDDLHVVIRIINCSAAANDGTCTTPNTRAITGGVLIDTPPITLPLDCARGVVISGAGTSDPPTCDPGTNTVQVNNISVPAGQTMLVSFWTAINCSNGIVSNLATFDYDQNPSDTPVNSRDPVGAFGATLTFQVGAITPNSPTKDAPLLPIGGTPVRRNGQWGISTPWVIEGSNTNCGPVTFQTAWDDADPDNCMDVDCSTLRLYRNGIPSPLPAGSLCPDPARPALFSLGEMTLQPFDTFRIEYDATFTSDPSVTECCNVMFFRSGMGPDATTVDPVLDTRLNPEYTCASLALATASAIDAIKDAEDAAGNRITTVAPGDEIYWHFILTSDARDPVNGTLTDDFPPEIILGPGAIVEPFPTGTCTIVGNRLECTDVTLPADGVPVEMRVRTTFDCTALSGGGTICNEATLTAGALSATTRCSTCLPAAPANLTCVTLEAPRFDFSPKRATDESGNGEIVVGERVTYSIDAINDGNMTATGVVVTDTIPADTNYVPGSLALDGVALSDAADADAGEVVGNVVTVRVGDVPVLDFSVGVVTFDVIIAAENGTQICNDDARIAWAEAALCAQPAFAVPAVCLPFESAAGLPQITATKSVSPTGTVLPGTLLHYTISACNGAGAATGTDVKLTDDIPAGATYVAGSLVYEGAAVTDADDADAGTLTSPTSVSFSLGDLPPGECRTAEFDVTVDALATADVVNVAFATADGILPARSNQVTTPVDTGVDPPQLTLSKTSVVGGDGVPRVDATITYSLTACNAAGAGIANNLVITDPVPSNPASGCGATYVAGSILVDGVAQTDAGDGDAGRFEALPAPGGVIVELATLDPGTCVDVSFQVRIAAGCDDGEFLDNTASADADGVGAVASNSTRDVVVDDGLPPQPQMLRKIGFPLANQCPDFPTTCGCAVGPRLDPATDDCVAAGTCMEIDPATWRVPGDVEVNVPLVFYELHRAGCQAAGDPTRLAVSKVGSDILLTLVP